MFTLAMALDNFDELLHKLKILHEREIEGWNDKVLELTNQKCCDTKQIEELFGRNQQLREQQRVLTENIKQLENRLRAGLCDRCTVTQDVAKRAQQEFENTQIQTLQHITVLVTEMTALKKENRKLLEEVKKLQGLIQDNNGRGSQTPTKEISQSPDPLLPDMAFAEAAMEASKHRQAGSAPVVTMVKSDPDHGHSSGAEEKLPGYRKLQSWSGQETYVSQKPPTPTICITRGNYAGQKRVCSTETMEQLHSPVSPSYAPPSTLMLMKSLQLSATSSSSSSSSSFSHAPTGDEKPARQGPVLYRPRPIKVARLSLPWALSEPQEWAALLPRSPLKDHGQKLLGLEHFPKGPGKHHREPSKRSIPELLSAIAPPMWKAPPTEGAKQTDSGKDREGAPPRWKCNSEESERPPVDNLKDALADAPLDLSDHKRPKPDKLPSPPQQVEATEDAEEPSRASATRTRRRMQMSSCSSSSPDASSSSQLRVSTSPPQEQVQRSGERSPQEKGEGSKGEKEEVNPELSINLGEKKVPALTISLHPVVVIESLNPALQKQNSSDNEMATTVNSDSSLERQVDGDYFSSQNGRRTRNRLALAREAPRRQSPKEHRGKNHGESSLSDAE